MYRERTMAALLTLVLSMPAGLIAQERPHQHDRAQAERGMMQQHAPMMRMPAMVLMHGEELGLSPQQRQRIESLHAETQRTMTPLMERMQGLHRRAAAITEAERFDEQAARTAAREAAQIHEAMMPAMLRAQHQVQQILTADQHRQLERLHREHHGAGEFHQGMGMMMHCPMMPGGMRHDGDHEHRHQ